MSEPSTAVPLDGLDENRALFQGVTNVFISGGVFYSIARDLNLQNIQVGGETVDSLVTKVVEMLREYFDVKSQIWDIHQDIVEKRTPGTGEVSYSSPDVEAWRKRVRGFIWATGGPGAGKTYLSSSVFDHLDALTKASSDAAASISYLRYTDTMTTWDVIMGIIVNLVQSKPLTAVLETIRDGFAQHRQRNSRPTLPQLAKILRSVAGKYGRCYIVIDGLDEVPQEVQDQLIDILTTLDANVLLMSRGLPTIQQKLEDQPSPPAYVYVTVAAQDEDLDLYISHVIEHTSILRDLLKKPGLREELARQIKAKADGMFLHVTLQMQALRDCLDVHEVFQVVKDFPSGMEALYLETMKRIGRQPRNHAARARHALNWVLHANRPLFFDDLLHAVAAFPPDYRVQPDRVLPDEAILARICCGLLAIDHATRHVRLVHLSARKHLEAILESQCPNPHEMMALTCMSVLTQAGFQKSTMSDLGQMKQAFADIPLLEYAYKSLGHHIRQSMRHGKSLLPQALEFVNGCESFPYHHPLFDSDHPTALQRLKPFHVGAYLNLPQIELLKHKHLDINAKASCNHREGWSSLMVACAEGHANVVRCLFDSSKLDANNLDANDMTPLMFWSSIGDYIAVKTLLSSNTTFERVVLKASKLIRSSRPANLVDVNHRNKAGETALMMASRNGNTFIVAALLATDTDVDINLQCANGSTAASFASQKDRRSVVELFLALPGFDPTRPDGNGETPLMVASRCGSAEVVKLLLAPGGIITVYSPLTAAYINPAYSAAVRNGQGAVVKLFLAVPGFEVNGRDSSGWTGLMRASYFGKKDVVAILLGVPQVDVNLQDNDGQSALTLAAEEGHEDVVKLLLGVAGVDLNHQDAESESALFKAAKKGHKGVVELLLAAPGVDVDIPAHLGKPAL